jgi:beta-phosphoglucomutase
MTGVVQVSDSKVLISDFDGVLADTEPLHWKSWAQLFARHGCVLSWEEYSRAGRGIRDEEMLDSLQRLDPLVRCALSRQIDERKEIVRRWYRIQLSITPSSVQVVKALTRFRLALVTGSERNEVEPLLRAAGIHECFDGCVYGDETRHSKPHPEPYLLIRWKLGVDKGLVIEDSEAVIQSATAAGFGVLRVNSPGDLPLLLMNLLRVEGASPHPLKQGEGADLSTRADKQLRDSCWPVRERLSAPTMARVAYWAPVSGRLGPPHPEDDEHRGNPGTLHRAIDSHMNYNPDNSAALRRI